MKDGQDNDPLFFGDEEDLVGETAGEHATHALVDQRILLRIARHGMENGGH